MTARVVGDLSRLPAAGFRSHGLWFWAAMAFMLMEGVGFALAGASYVYLMNGAAQWPLSDPPPDLFWGTAQTVVLLASVGPTVIMCRSARRREWANTRVARGAGTRSTWGSWWGGPIAALGGCAADASKL